MSTPTPEIQVHLNPANPGQFFACCGLLELADRLWNGAVGWFDRSQTVFSLAPEQNRQSLPKLLESLTQCRLSNTMTPAQLARKEELSGIKKRSAEQEEEKKSLEKLHRESPLILEQPFGLSLNWFLDSRGGGSRFKTWAGQQSVFTIAEEMKNPLGKGEYTKVPPADWLRHGTGSSVTFNFDADASTQAAPIDVGFSLDPLNMGSRSRPLLELLAFIGLQRFRPQADPRSNAYTYTLWTQPALPLSAMAITGGLVSLPSAASYCFPLLYRTKYLKSFLPAKPVN